MEKEFIPYEQALDLKELGFNYVSTIFAYDEAKEIYTRSGIPHDFNIRGLLSAPTFSQSFRWFREKYKIFSCITTEYSYGGHISTYHINGKHQSNIFKSDFNSYEEAELECLKQLIEIVKTKEVC